MYKDYGKLHSYVVLIKFLLKGVLMSDGFWAALFGMLALVVPIYFNYKRSVCAMNKAESTEKVVAENGAKVHYGNGKLISQVSFLLASLQRVTERLLITEEKTRWLYDQYNEGKSESEQEPQ